MSKSYVYLIFDLMLMKKIKQSKAIESNGGCYFRREEGGKEGRSEGGKGREGGRRRKLNQ